jgi:uncharacterized protein YndB with AHSA1/START domain
VIELVRVVDAPRSLVFAVWTDVRHLEQWWGPEGFTVQTIAGDVRVGGSWRFTMTGPDGKVWPNRITYRAIEPETRIVYEIDTGSDEPEDPQRFFAMATFEDAPEGTRVTMRSLFPSAEARAAVVAFGAIELGKTTLAKLERYAKRQPTG